MARYGDLDALEKKLFPMGMVDDGRYALPAKAVKVAIDRLPTADVVAVVRCKDCRWYNANDFECRGPLIRNTVTNPYDYCSRGERMDQNG